MAPPTLKHDDMTALAEVQLYRDAADVKRMHTMRTIRGQTVGAHSFNVMVLIQHVAPDCRKEVLVAAMRHDFTELHTGDIPAPIKRLHPRLKPLLEDIESGLAPLTRGVDLDPQEEALVNWADKVELLLWCREEYMMGNRYVNDVIDRLIEWVSTAPAPCPMAKDFFSELVLHFDDDKE